MVAIWNRAPSRRKNLKITKWHQEKTPITEYKTDFYCFILAILFITRLENYQNFRFTSPRERYSDVKYLPKMPMFIVQIECVCGAGHILDTNCTCLVQLLCQHMCHSVLFMFVFGRPLDRSLAGRVNLVKIDWGTDNKSNNSRNSIIWTKNETYN